jgi:hypothetical protein
MLPITIAAMDPALRRLDRLFPFPAAAAVSAAGVLVTVVTTFVSEAVATTGRTTPSHLEVVSENTQQESVELGELAAQYEQRPPRLFAYPQSVSSFV